MLRPTSSERDCIPGRIYSHINRVSDRTGRKPRQPLVNDAVDEFFAGRNVVDESSDQLARVAHC